MPAKNHNSPFHEIQNKSKLLKDWYGVSFVNILAGELGLSDQGRFVKEYKKKYRSLELKQRLNLVSDLLDLHLGSSYVGKLKKLKNLLGSEYPYETGMMNHGFYLYPISQFVENKALVDVSASLDFIYELTKRFTGEFAIRPIARHDKKRILKITKEWSRDRNFHVRRLASEGLRVRLPWGQGIDWVREDPALTLPVLNKLKNDPVLYVRRSVANAMGDIIKVDEELGFDTLTSWLKGNVSPEVCWVILHAIRHPVKKKDQRFMKLKEKVLLLRRS